MESSNHNIDESNKNDTKPNPRVEEQKPLMEEENFFPLQDLPPPPDGGWGWVITFASFMCNLILDGIAYTFGVLLNPLVEDFNSNRSTVSWVGSLLAGVYMTTGPIVGALVNKYGCRPVCIAGSLVAAVGIGLSIFSPNLPMLMITYGVIGGFGLGMVYLPAIVSVGYYFEKKRALATGISVCGSGVGTFLMAPLATHLLDSYGWKGANLIFAGLCLNCAVFGALMRPLELNTVVHKPNNELNLDEEDEDEDDEMSSAVQMVAIPFSDMPSYQRQPSGSEGPGHFIAVPALPTLAEESVTATVKEDRRAITDVFPEVQIKEASPKPKRSRTPSESASQAGHSRFLMTPVNDSSIPRNSSAPHFPEGSSRFLRNVSTPAFGKMTRISSNNRNSSFQDHIVFGVISNDPVNNTSIVLQPRKSSRKSSRPLVRPLYRKDVFYSGSIANIMGSEGEHPIPRPNTFVSVASQATLDGYRNSFISIPRGDMSRGNSFAALSFHRGSIVASHLSIPREIRKTSLSEQAGELELEPAKPIWTALKEMTNFHLLVNKYFMLIAISNVFGMLGFYVPFVYLPNMAVLRNVSVENANFLLSIIGISNTVGRVITGYFSDFPFVNSLFVTNMAILLSGLSVIVLPFCSSYEAFVCIALLFGLFVAAYISLTSIILVDLLGLDNLTSAFGLLVLFRGVASIIGPPVAGSVYDMTNSYDVSFFLAGGCLVIASLISFGAQVLQKMEENEKNRGEKDKSIDQATDPAQLY